MTFAGKETSGMPFKERRLDRRRRVRPGDQQRRLPLRRRRLLPAQEGQPALAVAALMWLKL